MAYPEVKLSLREKVGYALGDTAANITWRGVSTFLLVFYTDVFGISAAAAGVLLLITRFTDGITDIIMGMIADRTETKHGKFRPWILWSAPALGILLVLTFSTPDFSDSGKLVYAYITYILLTLAYTANNVPYSALMGVMTPDHQERASLSGFRFAGAFFGGFLVQVFLIYLVGFLGQGNEQLGFQYSMYLFAALSVGFLLITFFTTRERVEPSKSQQTNIGKDLKDLVTNLPWLILLVIGFLFVITNSIKQGITVIYFKHYVGMETMAATYMAGLLIISFVAALTVGPLVQWFGKKFLFIAAMLLGGVFTGLIYVAGPDQPTQVFVFGIIAEYFAGIMPVLFFAMLGDAADYSEWKNGRRATALVFSAGTFAMKFGGGVAGAIIGFVLAAYGYDGMDSSTIPGAAPGIKLLMSWIPTIFIFGGALIMLAYPLTKEKMAEIESELAARRGAEPA
jgi:GPH family glycoside/pentoside/hexuronide:cation symporter